MARPLLRALRLPFGRIAGLVLVLDGVGGLRRDSGIYMNQRGFGTIQIYAALAALLVIGLLTVAVRVQTARLSASEAKYEAFTAQVEALGRNQIAANKLKHKGDLAKTKELNNENKLLRGELDIFKRMRQSNPSGGKLPAVPAGSARPDLACFDRKEYEREDGIATAKLFAGARSLADEGSTCAIDLNTGKAWVKEQSAER